MKRYLSKQRDLTPEERSETHQRSVSAAQEEFDEAKRALNEAISAPFENSMIMDAREMAFAYASKPSPWLGLKERGVFPGGLSAV